MNKIAKASTQCAALGRLGLGDDRSVDAARRWIYVGALALMTMIGPVGARPHIRNDLAAGDRLVMGRLLRGAPIMAPLLFSIRGSWGRLCCWIRGIRGWCGGVTID